MDTYCYEVLFVQSHHFYFPSGRNCLISSSNHLAKLFQSCQFDRENLNLNIPPQEEIQGVMSDVCISFRRMCRTSGTIDF